MACVALWRGGGVGVAGVEVALAWHTAQLYCLPLEFTYTTLQFAVLPVTRTEIPPLPNFQQA